MFFSFTFKEDISDSIVFGAYNYIISWWWTTRSVYLGIFYVSNIMLILSNSFFDMVTKHPMCFPHVSLIWKIFFLLFCVDSRGLLVEWLASLITNCLNKHLQSANLICLVQIILSIFGIVYWTWTPSWFWFSSAGGRSRQTYTGRLVHLLQETTLQQ